MCQALFEATVHISSLYPHNNCVIGTATNARYTRKMAHGKLITFTSKITTKGWN